MTKQTDYEYSGLLATYWDLLRGDTSDWPDRRFFKTVVAESGQPVLDVGCGTGRLLLDFMIERVDIDGVDNSPEMLAICGEKAQKLGLHPTLFQRAMEALDLPRRYRTIVVPSSSFQLVTNPANARAAMKRFFSHLESNGKLVMPFMLLSSRENTEPVVTRETVYEGVRPEDGGLVRRSSRSTYDLVNQLEHTEDDYEVILNGEVIASEHYSRSPATRGYTQEQAVDSYRQAGFVDIQVTSGWTPNSATHADTLFCVSGTRP
ncbi:MAG: class I SAM-dependent methyltransferase [Dehalococcoidia bacterium]|nr:class I SAM-dependent methyltransferase [Dehalococcoidia bacterium]